MTAYFFRDVPAYGMQGFCAVRDAFDNLRNVLQLAELVNTCGHCMTTEEVDDFDFVVFSGNFSRTLIRRKGGYFSMSMPFQIVFEGDRISFNFDRIGHEVSGMFISVLRNALLTSQNGTFSHDDVVLSIVEAFAMDVSDAVMYFNAFVALLADDHGYFRFDDDPERQNGHVHPRYHFDFFYKNGSSIKIGTEENADMECFYELLDGERPKRYLRKAK